MEDMIKKTIEEMQEEKEREFKQALKAKIKKIFDDKAQIDALQAQLEKEKKELHEMQLKQFDVTVLF